LSFSSPSGAAPLPSTGRVSRPVIVSPEAAEDIRRAIEAASADGPSASEALEREVDAALEAIATTGAPAGSAIARHRVGTSAWAVLYVAEPRRVTVVALVRSRAKEPGNLTRAG